MEDRQTGLIVEGRVGHVVVVALAQNRRVGVVTAQDRVGVGGCGGRRRTRTAHQHHGHQGHEKSVKVFHKGWCLVVLQR